MGMALHPKTTFNVPNAMNRIEKRILLMKSLLS